MIYLHEHTPNKRDLQRVRQHLNAGGVVASPSATGYCLLIRVGNRDALQTVRALRGLDKHHLFTLFCHDLSMIAKKASMDDAIYRLLKKHTPSPCTFVLKASKQISKDILHPKRRTIGIRVPVEPILKALLAVFEEPLLSVSLQTQDDASVTLVAEDVKEMVGDAAMVLDVGHPCPVDVSTVVDCTAHPYQILRQGMYQLNER